MIGGSAILTDESNTEYQYSSLFSFDVTQKIESEDENGELKTETKVVTKNLGVCANKNSTPTLIWVAAADTFNRNASDMSDADLEQYTVAMQCLQYIVTSTKKTYQPTVESVSVNEYDIFTPLQIESGDSGFVGVVVIGIIPMLFLGTTMLSLYARKRRTKALM
jgi:hypothetical protein